MEDVRSVVAERVAALQALTGGAEKRMANHLEFARQLEREAAHLTSKLGARLGDLEWSVEVAGSWTCASGGGCVLW